MKEICRHLSPLFQENEVLFGHDATPRLIAFEVDGDAMLLDTRRAPPTGSPRSLSDWTGWERLISGTDVDEAKISCYVTSTKATKISENCKLASEWDQKSPRKPRALQSAVERTQGKV